MSPLKHAFISHGGKLITDTCRLAFTILLVLKLVDKITCSWAWVTAPVWGTLLLLLLFYVYAKRQYRNAVNNYQNALLAALAASSGVPKS